MDRNASETARRLLIQVPGFGRYSELKLSCVGARAIVGGSTLVETEGVNALPGVTQLRSATVSEQGWLHSSSLSAVSVALREVCFAAQIIVLQRIPFPLTRFAILNVLARPECVSTNTETGSAISAF